MRGIQWVPFLDYTDYNKQRCIDTLVNQIGYRPYPYKHYEVDLHAFLPGLPAANEVRRLTKPTTALLVANLFRTDDARAGQGTSGP